MLSVLLEHELGIDNYIKSNCDTLEEDYILLQDWKLLCTIYTFLKPFYCVILKTQGDYVTLNRVLFIIDVLIKHMENSLV